MSDPERLSSGDGAASALERRLLDAGRQRREPAGMRDRVLLGVSAAVAAGGVAAGSTVASASSASSASTAAAAATTSVPPTKAAATALALAKVKVLLATAVVVSGAAGTATYAARHSQPTTVTLSAPSAALAVPPAPVPRSAPPEPIAPAATPASEETTSVDDLPTAPTETRSLAPRARLGPSAAALPPTPTPLASERVETAAVSELREEAALVDEARRALAVGDTASASERLSRADARFPRGRLLEEREALAVRIAAAAGDGARAARLARAFLEKHPTSPLRPAIEPLSKKIENE